MPQATPTESSMSNLRACPCCGQAQTVPDVPVGMRACCVRCGSQLRTGRAALRGNSRTAAIALAALILYPLAILLPMLEVEQFGHRHDTSVLGGVATLLASGHLGVGVIVLLCSIVFPLCKLGALLVLSAGGLTMGRAHKAWMYRFVEWTGRWSMLDVLLVAILVAVIKVGDFVDVSAGPAAFAFACCVTLSLAATATFDPHSLWAVGSPPEGQTHE